MREIPLAATAVYMRKISKYQRLCRFIMKTFGFKKVTYMTRDVLRSESLAQFMGKEQMEVETVSITSLEAQAHEKKRIVYFDSYV